MQLPPRPTRKGWRWRARVTTWPKPAVLLHSLGRRPASRVTTSGLTRCSPKPSRSSGKPRPENAAITDARPPVEPAQQPGIVAKRLGDYERASSLLQESMDWKRAHGDQLGLAAPWSTWGTWALAQRDYAGAEASLRQSMRIRQSLDDRQDGAPSCGMAELALARQQPVRSRAPLRAAEALRRAFHFPLPAGAHTENERLIDLAASSSARPICRGLGPGRIDEPGAGHRVCPGARSATR